MNITGSPRRAVGDLPGGGMRQRIGAADHETVECQPRIERRTAERVMLAGGDGCVAPRCGPRSYPSRCSRGVSRRGSTGLTGVVVAWRTTAERMPTSIRTTSGMADCQQASSFSA